MNHPALATARRSQLTLLVWALLALPLLSCFEPASVLCPSGLVCPEGQLRAATQDTGIIADAGEACGDGNMLNGDGCREDCKADERCGNGKLDLNMGEVCDDGNTAADDGCSANCKSNVFCGNAVIDEVKSEVCEDGN